MRPRVAVVVHDVSSAQRLIDMAKLVYGLGFTHLVATKVYGAAASSGVPEAMRLALRLGRSFSVLPSVKDAVEILSPGRIVVVSREYGEPVDPWSYAEKLAGEESLMIVLGGIDAAPGRDVAGLGEAVYPVGSEGRLTPVAEAALLLYPLARRISRETS
ncbi:hypothetical protein CF15_05040 [Pyrodictium occultum]|uniref:Recombinase RecB n=1 Tax=Pyrodictium occultum TaxID=2309 RepID=A0A0V8RVQ2_PYROC|nr:RecB-family nuclease [Pyrodictium occultum]KSW12134.1 hypothetical protein CF15_05040 [Pyrodictium occultum]